MADLGPDPDRSASGEWSPGQSTGVVLIPSSAGMSFNDLHWAAIRPFAQMVVAKLGSLAPNQYTPVCGIWTGTEYLIQFGAKRSADGTTVDLLFEMKFEFTGGHAWGWSTEPWLGADHVYAWAHHSWVYFDSRASQGVVSSKVTCDTGAASLSNYSGAGHLFIPALATRAMEVPSSAISDLRVLYTAAWWNPSAPVSPNQAQFDNRFGAYTCQSTGWLIGQVGIG